MTAHLPLSGIRVLDVSQFLAGPSAAARLGELGAEVIKLERFPHGDPSRSMVVASGSSIGGDSLVFHAINRGKRSVMLDLKSEQGHRRAQELAAQADVLIESFRPGVMARLGLDYASVAAINPGVIYGRVTGYGDTGPWADRPGQDLLAQALTGLCWLQGPAGAPPTPIGFSIVDAAAGSALTQGLLAVLLRRERRGGGGLVEVSLLEAAVDLQFEVLTLQLNQGDTARTEGVPRSGLSPAHPWLAAPYGVYETSDSWVALAMGAVDRLGSVLQDPNLAARHDPALWWSDRDEIKERVADLLRVRKIDEVVQELLANGMWAAEVLAWEQMVAHAGFQELDLLQELSRPQTDGHLGDTVTTTRCPFRIDGQVLPARGPAPRLDTHHGDFGEEP